MAIELSEKEFSATEKILPEVVSITPGGNYFDLDFAELWRYRELLYFLAWRDVKVRYKQTILGVIWVLLQPVLTTLIFTILFARFQPTEGEKIPFWLFVFCGFVLWSFTTNALTNAANSLTNNTQLVTKVYFPRLVVPLAAIAATALDLLLSLIILLAAILLRAFEQISWTIIFAPAFVLLLLIFAFAAGTILAALNVRFRDVRFVLPFALQVLMFASPIFYSLDFLPENARFVWRLNPLAGILNGFRASIFGADFDFVSIAAAFFVTVALFFIALFAFRKMEEDFADLI